jgi:hypothetical protein
MLLDFFDKIEFAGLEPAQTRQSGNPQTRKNIIHSKWK